MARRGLSDDVRQAAALQAALRTIARGGRPLYRVSLGPDGRWQVESRPWLLLTATNRRDVIDEARRRITDWLECSPEAFDIEA